MMTTHSPFGDGELIDSLRISDAQWYACLDQMGLSSRRSDQPVDGRSSIRYPYRNIARVIVVFQSYDGAIQRFKVRGYDMSQTGMGFLHGAYIYDKTRIDLFIQHHVDGMIRIPATVVGCTHVKDRIHRVGVKFDQPIDLGGYLMSEAG